jgi:hypothetical protein
MLSTEHTDGGLLTRHRRCLKVDIQDEIDLALLEMKVETSFRRSMIG